MVAEVVGQKAGDEVVAVVVPWVAAQRQRVACVLAGDFADMPSLSSYDKGKRGFEGRRYVRDIEAANEALRLIHAQLPKDYAPEFAVTLGNHEARIDRAANDAAEFEGLISTSDLDFARRGWRVTPYMESTEIDGVQYSHCVPSGVMNRPIGGAHQANALVRKRVWRRV